MDCYLNELSLPQLQTRADARNLFNELGECYKAARSLGLKNIKIHSSFYNHQFAPGYTFTNWMSDSQADVDLKTLLKGVMSQQPFVDTILSEPENSGLEMKFDNQICYGLGLASNKIYDSVALSYNTTSWNLKQYSISIDFLEESDDGTIDLKTDDAISFNISDISSVTHHTCFINSKIAHTINGGKMLWMKKDELFPNLLFCDSVKNQIQELKQTSVTFLPIVNHLFNLQNVSMNFDGMPFSQDMYPKKVSPESDSREKRLKPELTFTAPDGNDYLCSWHCRYTPGAGRIHFFPLETQKKSIIGYIGPKIE